MKVLLSLLVLSLTGCGLCPTREPIVTTKTVEVPVPVKCEIKLPPIPTDSLLAVRLADPSYARASAVLKDLEAYRWYARELEAALRECVTSPH